MSSLKLDDFRNLAAALTPDKVRGFPPLAIVAVAHSFGLSPTDPIVAWRDGDVTRVLGVRGGLLIEISAHDAPDNEPQEVAAIGRSLADVAAVEAQRVENLDMAFGDPSWDIRAWRLCLCDGVTLEPPITNHHQAEAMERIVQAALERLAGP